MAAYSFVISIALILAITIPSSLGHREHHRHHHKHHHREHDREKSNMEQELRDLCSNTHNSKECWNIIKPKLDRFDDDNWRGVAVAAIDLAMEKADQIHDQLNGLHRDSSDDKLKDKYMTCSKNYNDAHHNLELAKTNLDSDHYQNIFVEIEDAQQELKNCKHEFDKDSFDPAHIGKRNKEFDNYFDIVKAATERLQKEYA